MLIIGIKEDLRYNTTEIPMAEKVILLMSTFLAIRKIQTDDDRNYRLYLLACTILSSFLDLFEIPIAGKRKGSYGLYYGCTLITGILLCMGTSSSLASEYGYVLEPVLNDSFTSSAWLLIFFYLHLASENFHILSMSGDQLRLYFVLAVSMAIANFMCSFNIWTLFQITATLLGIKLTSKYLPNCFTCGELVMLLQILFSFLRVFTSNFKFTSVLSMLSCQILVFLIIVILCLVSLNFFGSLSLIRFYTSCFLLISALILSVLLTSTTNLLTWGIEFLCENFPYRQTLIGFWLLELSLCAIYVMFRSNRKSSTTERKFFHLIILFTYIPAILCDIELLVLGSVLATSLLILLEVVRALRVTAMAQVLDEKFRVFLDPQDSGCLILTPIYLLLGQSLPIWATFFEHGKLIVQRQVMPLCIYSGLSSVAVGDSAASVIGSKFGQFKWPGSSKTVEGTIAAFLSQILFFISLYGLNAMSFHVILTIAAVSLAEAFTGQIDNLVLPIFMYFLLSCNNLQLLK